MQEAFVQEANVLGGRFIQVEHKSPKDKTEQTFPDPPQKVVGRYPFVTIFTLNMTSTIVCYFFIKISSRLRFQLNLVNKLISLVYNIVFVYFIVFTSPH